MKRFIIAASALMLLLASCASEKNNQAANGARSNDEMTASEPGEVEDTGTTEESAMTTTALGVGYVDLVVGEGAACSLGSKVMCHYTLWFGDSTGAKLQRFQSSKDAPGQPYQCTLGQRLIQGWSDGMVGMKEGGTRRLIVSPELGYGAGSGPIPANQWLVFEIDLLEILP